MFPTDVSTPAATADAAAWRRVTAQLPCLRADACCTAAALASSADASFQAPIPTLGSCCSARSTASCACPTPTTTTSRPCLCALGWAARLGACFLRQLCSSLAAASRRLTRSQHCAPPQGAADAGAQLGAGSLPSHGRRHAGERVRGPLGGRRRGLRLRAADLPALARPAPTATRVVTLRPHCSALWRTLLWACRAWSTLWTVRGRRLALPACQACPACLPEQGRRWAIRALAEGRHPNPASICLPLPSTPHTQPPAARTKWLDDGLRAALDGGIAQVRPHWLSWLITG